MIEFDPGWSALEERLRLTESPRQRQLLTTAITHAKAEFAADLDGIMNTLAPDPQYYMWGVGGQNRDTGPKGRDAVKDYYRKMAIVGGLAFTSAPKDRVIVDDNCVSHEGDLITLAPGKVAIERGYSVDDGASDYLIWSRLSVNIAFDQDGQILGEHVYIIPNVENFNKVDRTELPAAYLDYLARLGLDM